MGAVFALFSGWYFWSPKILGQPYNELLGTIHFWSFFIGVNLTFFPMHFLGLSGMPRRIADYPDAFAGWNLVASIGSYISAFGILVFLYLLFVTFTRGQRVGENPWGAGATTLEWKLSSPPPFHSYEDLPHLTAEPA